MTVRAKLDITLYVDGASRGNPGQAGIGVRIEANGQVLKELGEYIGKATNNTAEYRALIRGLQAARELGATGAEVNSDSELIVNQVNGSYRVKKASLLPLYLEVRKLAEGFSPFRIRHVPRAENRQADRLANEGIEKGSASIRIADSCVDKQAGWPHPSG